MNYLPMESERLWLRALLWHWRNGGDTAQIDELRKKNVEPSAGVSIFLENLQHARDRQLRKLLPLRSGRTQGLDVFIESTIDSDLKRLKSEGRTFAEIARRLEVRWERKFSPLSLRQRLHRTKRRQRTDSIAEFAKLFDVYSKRRYF